MNHSEATPTPTLLGLGLDAGGTQTRWALARPDGRVVAEGQVGPLNAMQVATPAGRQLWADTLAELARVVLPVGQPVRVHAGLTGYGGQRADIAPLLATHLGLPLAAVGLANDAEVAYLDVFKPGEGYLVYAGTGSIATCFEADGSFHRAGGLGGVIDDGGSGHWIARQALRHIWRSEDETPGAGRQSAMAQAVWAQVGGHEWQHTRHFLSLADRGDLGRLALAVAATADTDPQALAILQAAGVELARLGRILISRNGLRPIALAGRVWQLHPAVESACRAALPPVAVVKRSSPQGHHAAARIAAELVSVPGAQKR